MQEGRIYRDNELLIERVWRADTMLARAMGLLGRPPLRPSEGMMIMPCSSIHTFGMRYELDVVFMDVANKVVRVIHGLGKWRIAVSPRAKWTLELPAGEAERLHIRMGDELKWRRA
jgi:uncharacterized membrane protein (UPF0127 family)